MTNNSYGLAKAPTKVTRAAKAWQHHTREMTATGYNMAVACDVHENNLCHVSAAPVQQAQPNSPPVAADNGLMPRCPPVYERKGFPISLEVDVVANSRPIFRVRESTLGGCSHDCREAV